MKALSRIFLIAILALIFNVTAYAEDKPADALPPGMDPAKMEKMKEAMTPNENHKALEAFAGEWKYTGSMWMKADGPASPLEGKTQGEMIYGGRFLKQEIEGPFMGEKFEGLGYTGYDNVKKEYVSIWFDSMGTAIWKYTGQYDAASKTLTLGGKNSCPMAENDEKEVESRVEWKLVDDKTFTYTSWAKDKDGKEFKTMELTYTK